MPQNLLSKIKSLTAVSRAAAERIKNKDDFYRPDAALKSIAGELARLTGADAQITPRAGVSFPVTDGGGDEAFLTINKSGQLTGDDAILAEIAASYIHVIMSVCSAAARLCDEAGAYDKKTAVKAALNLLTYSELSAAIHIFGSFEPGSRQCLIIAGKVAENAGLTRSVLINALRKLESAGVVETRSLGVKGTHISVQNLLIFDELDKIK